MEQQTTQQDQSRAETGADIGRYLRFLAMIATSVVVMYVLTYTNAHRDRLLHRRKVTKSLSSWH
jgi:cadmium resistance protein CadD (predicted permease)